MNGMKFFINQELDRIQNPEIAREFSPIFDSVRDLAFTITDVAGVSSRVLSYWSGQGLLFENYKENKWRRLDLVGLTWVEMILKMRSYGISFETIRKIRQDLQPMGLADHILNSQDLRELILDLAKRDNQAVPDLEKILADPEVREEIRGQIPNYLKILILDAIIVKDHIALLINHDGFVLPYKESFRDTYLETPELRQFLMSTFLTVSITDILIEFFAGHEPVFLCDEMKLLTVEESAVLQAIRQPGIKSVLVKLDSTGEFSLLEITRVKILNRANKLYEIMLQGGYEKITIETQKGEIVYCENTTRKRFKDFGTG
ncbi:MAG: MerR family transcriptional regulator [Bacteroidales bacterium]|jgi:DNA-binding transcriptional MerR regulator